MGKARISTRRFVSPLASFIFLLRAPRLPPRRPGPDMCVPRNIRSINREQVYVCKREVSLYGPL